MIPSLLSTLDRRIAAERPHNFRLIAGPSRVTRVIPTDYARALGRTDAQRTGLRYEEKVQRALLDRFEPEAYWSAPHIHFCDNSGHRTAMPDGLLTLDGIKYVFEIKIGHCAQAWWQLERLYRPLVEQYYHSFEVRVCEICRSFDPAVSFPATIKRLESLDDLSSLGRDDFGVLTWRP